MPVRHRYFWKRFYRFVQPYLGTFLCAMLFGAVAVALSFLPPALSRIMFDVAFPNKDAGLFFTLILSLCALAALRFALGAVNDLLELYLSEEVSFKMTQKTFAKLSHLPISFLQKRSPGDLLLRLTDDVQQAKDLLLGLPPTLILESLKLIGLVCVLWWLQPKLTLIVLAAFPFYYLETRFFARELYKAQDERVQQEAGVLSRLQEQLHNMRTIKVFNQEMNESRKLGGNLSDKYRASLVTRGLDILNSFFHSLTLQLWTVFLVWYLGRMLLQGTISLGEVVSFLLYTEMLASPIQNLLGLAMNVSSSMVSLERINEILAAPIEQGVLENHEHEVKNASLKMDNLSCSYHKLHNTLQNVNLELKPCTLTALIGKSGAGKTTLANILLRLIPSNEGAIYLDGHNIRELAVKNLREQICMVEQEAVLFTGTILENILYGNPDKSALDAIRAARQAGALEFIEALPQGFATDVGLHTEQLSVGQRQRISIARALLRDPKIIIFDEVTSALDAESELAIQETLQRLRLSKTLLVITHRLSTLHSADNIIMLEKGKVVEQGTFENLLHNKDKFFWFYWAQFGGLGKLKEYLELEFERSKRYQSHYGLGALQLVSAENKELSRERLLELEKYLKLQLRAGDQIALWRENTLIMLLPELNEAHVKLFLERIDNLLQTWLTNDETQLKLEYRLTSLAVEKQPWRSSSELLYDFAQSLKRSHDRVTCLREADCHVSRTDEEKGINYAV